MVYEKIIIQFFYSIYNNNVLYFSILLCNLRWSIIIVKYVTIKIKSDLYQKGQNENIVLQVKYSRKQLSPLIVVVTPMGKFIYIKKLNGLLIMTK